MDNRKKDDSLAEEVSAFGQRVKGAAKDATGAVTGNRSLEREGERENAQGRFRQATNDVLDETDAVRGRSVGDRTGVTPESSTRYKDDSVAEETAALGQRVKGAVKDMTGAAIGNRSLEREGERENAEGRRRQATNDVMDETDGVRGRTVGDRSGYVTGLYDSPDAASRAYQGLRDTHGYDPKDIDVLMTDDTRTRHFGDVTPGTEFSSGTKAAEGLGKGSAIGGGVGAALGALFAVVTSIVIPGLGLVVAGPIAAALAGAGAGGATGGIIGALVGAGIPKDRAASYEAGLKQGGILIGTRARDEQHAAELEREFGTYGGRDIQR